MLRGHGGTRPESTCTNWGGGGLGAPAGDRLSPRRASVPIYKVRGKETRWV